MAPRIQAAALAILSMVIALLASATTLLSAVYGPNLLTALAAVIAFLSSGAALGLGVVALRAVGDPPAITDHSEADHSALE